MDYLDVWSWKLKGKILNLSVVDVKALNDFCEIPKGCSDCSVHNFVTIIITKGVYKKAEGKNFHLKASFYMPL